MERNTNTITYRLAMSIVVVWCLLVGGYGYSTDFFGDQSFALAMKFSERVGWGDYEWFKWRSYFYGAIIAQWLVLPSVALLLLAAYYGSVIQKTKMYTAWYMGWLLGVKPPER